MRTKLELIDTIKDYGPTEEDALIIKKFIEDFPEDVKLPILMANDEGEMGMYWDDDKNYVDIDLDKNKTMSIYSRIRVPLHEEFFDNLIDNSWIYSYVEKIMGKL